MEQKERDPLAAPHNPHGAMNERDAGYHRDQHQPGARSTMLRYSHPICIPAGAEWPACDPNGATPPKRFRWLMVENRAVYASSNDAYISLTDRPVVADQTSWYMVVPAGTKRIRCVSGTRRVEANPLRLRILNAGAAAIVLWVECDDEDIYDKSDKIFP